MSEKKNQQVALVTGASSGIGQATASLLYAKGWLVYGLSRSGQVPQGVTPLIADVAVFADLEAALASLWSQTKQLDLIVNAAGIGGTGPIEGYPADEAHKIIDINLMGSLYLAQVSLPYLRKQRYGKLIYISSIAGLMGLPFHGIYSASKFAVEGLVESLRLELKGTGVQVVSVCPGDTDTPILGNQYRAPVKDLPANYRENYQRADEAMQYSVSEGIPATQVAESIIRIASLRSPNVRYFVGEWVQKIAPLVKRWLPMRLFERILAKYYGVS